MQSVRLVVRPQLETYVAAFTTLAIASCPLLHSDLPLYAALVLGGAPLVWNLARKLIARDFGSDLLAGLAIVSAAMMHEYLKPAS